MNNMRRSGFTMIELIFVIVILGILASVAIPKLAATRDDAKQATAATSIANAVTEISSYYTATGDFNLTRAAEMSNEIIGGSWDYADLVNNVGPLEIDYQINSNDCIRLSVGSGDLNISHIAFAGTGSSATLCTNIQNMVGETNTSIGGSSVNFD